MSIEFTRHGRWRVENFSEHDTEKEALEHAANKSIELQRPIIITPPSYEVDAVGIGENVGQNVGENIGSSGDPYIPPSNTGTWGEGNTITLSLPGINIGTNGMAGYPAENSGFGPVLWDDFSDGTLSAYLNSTPKYGQWDVNVHGASGQKSIYDNTHVLRSGMQSCLAQFGAYDGADPSWLNFNNGDSYNGLDAWPLDNTVNGFKIYVDYFYYVDSAGAGYSQGQFKRIQYHNSLNGAPGNWSPGLWNSGAAANGDYKTSLYYSNTPFDDDVYDQAPNTAEATDTWIHHSILYEQSTPNTSDGSLIWWRNGATLNGRNEYGTQKTRTNSGEGPNFVELCAGWTGRSAAVNCWLADCYIHIGSWARVILTNAQLTVDALYDASEHTTTGYAMQRVTRWDNTAKEIDIVAHQGALSSFSGAYVNVIDDNNYVRYSALTGA